MICPSALGGTATEAVTKRYFDPGLMRATPLVEGMITLKDGLTRLAYQ